VGESMARNLLTTFGSVAAIRRAEPDELMRAPGIGQKLAQTIHSHLHGLPR
jgi:excinuclease ABC subunit C